MIQATNKTERFADYINAMSFSEVIEFFNFMMEDMMQIENHAMFDWTIQKDAENILNQIGVKAFVGMFNGQYEERAVMCSVNQKGELNYEWGLNPWTEILDGYSEWIISHIEDCMNGVKDGSFIEEKYPELFDVVREPKVKVKVAVHKTLTRIVEVEARTHAEAEEWIAKNFEKCDPLMKCDSIGEYFTEILPN